MVNHLYGITGTTGAVGKMVAEGLAKKSVQQRLIVRDSQRAPKIDGAEVVQVEEGYIDKAGMTQALHGVNTLFLVSGHFSDDRVKDHCTAIDAAVDAGVTRIVYLSFLDAAVDSTFLAGRDHYATENYIREKGISFTFLRNGLYADIIPYSFGKDGVIRGPAADGRVSYVTRADIVEVAVIVLSEDGHDNKTYNNTGREALSLSETAEILSEYTERQCSYYNETMEEARASRAVYGEPDNIVDIWISTYTAMANDEMSHISDDIERLTGHPAQTLRAFLDSHPESYQHIIDGEAAE